MEEIIMYPIPRGHHTVAPYMIIREAAKAIEFYKKAFGASEVMCLKNDNGKIKHAEIKIGDSIIMIVDEFPDFELMRGPQSLGGSSMHIFLYVEDVDSLYRQAMEAGAKELAPVEDQADGDRRGGLIDPFGHIWWMATHVKDVRLEE